MKSQNILHYQGKPVFDKFMKTYWLLPDERKDIVSKYTGLDGGTAMWRNVSAHIDGEVWVPLFADNLYSASSLGRIRSPKGRIILQHIDRHGYLKASIYPNGGKYHTTAHSLVLKSFSEKPQGIIEVNHMWGVKCFNEIHNLEWSTKSNNLQHAIENNLKPPSSGEKNGTASISNEQAIKIFNDSRPPKLIAMDFHIRRSTVDRIKSGELWSSVTGKEYIGKRISKAQVLGAVSSNLPDEEICNKFKITKKMLYSIRRGISWSSITGIKYDKIKNYFASEREIQEIISSPLSAKCLSKIYNRSASTICRIKNLNK